MGSGVGLSRWPFPSRDRRRSALLAADGDAASAVTSPGSRGRTGQAVIPSGSAAPSKGLEGLLTRNPPDPTASPRPQRGSALRPSQPSHEIALSASHSIRGRTLPKQPAEAACQSSYGAASRSWRGRLRDSECRLPSLRGGRADGTGRVRGAPAAPGSPPGSRHPGPRPRRGAPPPACSTARPATSPRRLEAQATHFLNQFLYLNNLVK